MKSRKWFYAAVAAAAALGAALTAALLLNISERKREGLQSHVRLVDLDENTVDPAVWARNFPRQYDGYKRTVDIQRTRHGGSDAISKLESDPRLKKIFAGYAFSIDYREERGHAYMLQDQDETERVKQKKQPGACLHCHSSVLPAYREMGGGDVMKGFAVLNAMDWKQARTHVAHPVSCVDCHDPKTSELRVTRPAFLLAMAQVKKKEGVDGYDVNRDATRQEMRTFACAQCHVEYYFKGKGKMLTYPWSKGLKIEDMEAYYDEDGFEDWEHAETGAGVLKAQHPEFELWSQGIHARSGVSCADCHMPYKREGAVKISDHHVRSPLLNVARACQTCHHFPESEMLARATMIQDRTKALLDRSEDALVALIDALKKARSGGVSGERISRAQKLQRRAQFRVDFINAENSMGFHAPQEAARILAEAIDYARQGQLALKGEPL